MFNRNELPPCPDPDRYILVQSKDGMFWRKKRGSVKKAKLNDGFSKAVERTRLCAPAAKRIVTRLRHYTDGLEMGRITLKVCTLLRKQLKATGKTGVSCMRDMDLQPHHPIHALLKTGYQVEVNNGMLEARLRIRDNTIKRNNSLVSHYFFELVLLYGDCMEENSLRTESETSDVYDINQDGGECRMQMVLPEKEWVALLKVTCIEGNEMALCARNYGMKVVGGGE